MLFDVMTGAGLPSSTSRNMPPNPSDGRLSIEFANHNWFMDKYSLQNSAKPDTEQQALTKKRKNRQKIDITDSETSRRKKPQKCIHHAAQIIPNTDANSLLLSVTQDQPTDTLASLLQSSNLPKEDDSLIVSRHSETDNVSNLQHALSDNTDVEVKINKAICQETLPSYADPNSDHTHLKILEVVSLAELVRHNNNGNDDVSTTPYDGVSQTMDTKDDSLNIQSVLPDVVPPASDQEPQDLSIKSSSCEPMPLDLSTKSSICAALDLSTKALSSKVFPDDKPVSQEVHKKTVANSVYTCFNISEGKNASYGNAIDKCEESEEIHPTSTVQHVPCLTKLYTNTDAPVPQTKAERTISQHMPTRISHLNMNGKAHQEQTLTLSNCMFNASQQCTIMSPRYLPTVIPRPRIHSCTARQTLALTSDVHNQQIQHPATFTGHTHQPRYRVSTRAAQPRVLYHQPLQKQQQTPVISQNHVLSNDIKRSSKPASPIVIVPQQNHKRIDAVSQSDNELQFQVKSTYLHTYII